AEDGAVGEAWLRTFQDNEKTIPTILTTSQKLSTGVDARNIRNIVLMRPVKSMIEFKQIIGRGTRTYEGKDYFTIWDFVKAHLNFQDPEWDGEPDDPEPPTPRPPSGPSDPADPSPKPDDTSEDDEKPAKIRISLSDGSVRDIRYLATTTYWSADGRPITAQQFLEQLFGDLSGLIKDEDELRKKWSNPTTRVALVQQLFDRGYDAEKLKEIRRMVSAEKSDLFDVLAYILYQVEQKTREERVEAAKPDVESLENGDLRELLASVLSAYEDKGFEELQMDKLGEYLTARFGGVSEAKSKIGDLGRIRAAFLKVQEALYRQ
ncbi:MAG: restriction endonuclease subunit R, partial [Mameliella sp.]|nr:restriction endonuclease subunit R [Mameliella sp.]